MLRSTRSHRRAPPAGELRVGGPLAPGELTAAAVPPGAGDGPLDVRPPDGAIDRRADGLQPARPTIASAKAPRPISARNVRRSIGPGTSICIAPRSGSGQPTTAYVPSPSSGTACMAAESALAARRTSRLHSRGPRAPGRGPRPVEARSMVALAQPAEHRIVDPKVMGSTPIGHPKTSGNRNSRAGHPLGCSMCPTRLEEAPGRSDYRSASWRCPWPLARSWHPACRHRHPRRTGRGSPGRRSHRPRGRARRP